MEYVQYEQGYTVQVRHIISTNEDFWYKVKCIISMNKIWSAGKAHHQVLKKGQALIVQYTAFDELYFLYSIQLEMLCTSQLRVHQTVKFPCTYIHQFLP